MPLEALRALPKVDALLAHETFQTLLSEHGRPLVLDAVRADLDALRAAIRADELEAPEAACSPAACARRADERLRAHTRHFYARALNATGVVIHTGLGRAPLSTPARDTLSELGRSYAILEVDPRTGLRGHRDDGITGIVRELTGAEATCVVNNNAGATLLSLAALAAGRPVVVSRGQLVEIGGSFRIPDVMAQSGARLVEVGATNRTHRRDYERALVEHPEAALLLRVHTSNFRIVGFTREVSLDELVALGRERGVPVMDDLGSGCLVDLAPYGLPGEPLVADSLRTGAAVVTSSGDKLLGGPQAGIITGTREQVARIRKHPLYRALRPDKLILGALEATLALYRDRDRVMQRVPVLRMISLSLDLLEQRAQALATRLRAGHPGLEARVEDGSSKVGGGSYAVEELPTRVVTLTGEGISVEGLARRLREGRPALFTRIREGRLLLDPRTLLGPEEDAEAARLILDALAGRSA